MRIKRSLAFSMLALLMGATLIATAGPAIAAGGDFSLDFVAAGPFTYDHDTAEGGEFADRTISKTEGVVESLEGGDFACGDKVVYFVEITVDPAASSEQDIELDFAFLAEPTGQPGVGQVELVSASDNGDDSGNAGDTADTTVDILSQDIDEDPPPAKSTLFATVVVGNLDPAEVFILRLVTLLECTGQDPTGNLQADISAGRVVAPEADTINVGEQTIPFKSVADIEQPPQPASVEIAVGACPAPGSPTVPVTVTIDPPGSAVVTIDGPDNAQYVVDGDGAELDLPPGDYHAEAVAEEGFVLDDGSFDFTVQACPEVLASVTVQVGACPPTSSATKPATVTINPDGAAEVTITGPNGFNQVVSGTGATLDLAPGDYAWSATATDGFELIGAANGALAVGSCVIEVLPKTELPKTGANLPGLAGIGFTFLFLGFGMVALSRRPSLELAGIVSHSAVLHRLSGRGDWSGFFAERWLLGVLRLGSFRGGSRKRAVRRRSKPDRHR